MSSRRSGKFKSEVLIKVVACCSTPSQGSLFAPRGHADARAESESVGATCLVACNADQPLCGKFKFQNGFWGAKDAAWTQV